ncbi:uncharacterized protein LOC129308901 [Prosopis cineraria]|uniref:uncharacterized protein LOC129308901 n=1 Tax=Prosopis cineraria TaxID=364024 RepID=UPI00240ECF0F|nr:uncharacterized protein LOC129308901 [Prosopis cineraria]
MALEGSTNLSHTGKLYQGKGIKLSVKVEPLETLIELSRHIKGKIMQDFKRKYGNILDLLPVTIHNDAIMELSQYWDASLRCFTFQDFQMAPTLEEYGEILRMPLKENMAVYLYPGYLPSRGTIAKILEIPKEKVRMVCPGQTEGISRADVEAHLKVLAGKEAWVTFCRVFALCIYGIILFPSSIGIIDLGAISVFQMVEYHNVNPVPAILAETYLTLTQCHDKGKGKVNCCIALLDLWMLGHLYGKTLPFRKKNDSDSNPLMSFKGQFMIDGMSYMDWKRTFSELKESSILWKLDWWWKEEVIYHCGDFPNVPLMGPRGCINYNPSLALRQLAYKQNVPSKKEVQELYFLHKEDGTKLLSQNVKEAWQEIGYKGKIELGIRVVNSSPEYTTWLKSMIQGANPLFHPQNPLLGNDLKEINGQLVECLKMKENELQALANLESKNKEELEKYQNECENAKLKREVQTSDNKVQSTKARLVKIVRENDALKKELQDIRPIEEMQQEINTLTRQLERKVNELARVRGSAAETAQNFVQRLNQQNEVLEEWKSLCLDQTEETKEWMLKCRQIIDLANDKIPEFARAFKQAEGMVLPGGTPLEIVEFFHLCNEIVKELNSVTKF